MKKFLIAALVSLVHFCLPVMADNPMQADPNRLTRIVLGRYGIDTNGAVAGQAVTFNGTSVVWGAGGGGGGGTVTNATTTGLPWITATGAGTEILNFSTNTTKIPIGNIASGFAVLSANNIFANDTTNTFPFINVTNIVIKSIRSEVGTVIASFDENNGDIFIAYTNGNSAIYINQSPSGGRTDFFDENGSIVARIGIGNTFFRDQGGSDALAIDGRQLKWGGGGNEYSFKWFNGGTTNNGGQVVTARLHTLGVVTNAGTVDNQSRVLNAAAVTNASTMVNNGLTTLNGGLVLNRVTKSANYTNSASDYMISWAGTTSAQPTNSLPATPPNGTTYVIKDGQRSASTTNIVIFPLGSDTIGGATSTRLIQNGQAITVTYNSTTANWEPN